MNKNETAAFEQGRKDRKDGGANQNPYAPLSSLGKLWSAGFDMEDQRAKVSLPKDGDA